MTDLAAFNAKEYFKCPHL